jgi:WD domain, G-beta repeat
VSRIQITRLIDLHDQVTDSNPPNTDSSNSDAPLNVFTDKRARWFVLFNAVDHLYFRELDPRVAGYDAEAIMSMQFNAIPLCHSIHPHYQTCSSVQVISGFQRGTVWRYNPFGESKVQDSYFNRKSYINATDAVAVCWIPAAASSKITTGSNQKQDHKNAPSAPFFDGHHFVVAHKDGSMYVYDSNLSSEMKLPMIARQQHRSARHQTKLMDEDKKHGVLCDVEHQRASSCNPRAFWRIGRVMSTIRELKFSYCGRYLAAVQANGYLHVIDFVQDKIMITFKSYFGGLNCVAWSPDDRIIVTGGEDDMLTAWDPWQGRVIAHFEGHTAWVSSVSFRYTPEHCSTERAPRVYSFVSGGQDGGLLFWELEAKHIDPDDSNNESSASAHRQRRPSADLPRLVLHPSKKDVIVIDPVAVNWAHKMPISSVATATHWATVQRRQLRTATNQPEYVEPISRLNDFLSSSCDGNLVRYWATALPSVKQSSSSSPTQNT